MKQHASWFILGIAVSLIDRNGTVVAKWTSPLNERGLELEMAKLMK